MMQNIKERLQALPNPSDRKLTLFACACIREVWHLLKDERSRRSVEAAEAFVEGLASIEEVQNAVVAAYDAWLVNPTFTNHPSYAAAFATSAIYAVFCASNDKQIDKQHQIFDDIFGS